MTRQQSKWDRRDKKRDKKKHGMRISGRSILTLSDIIREKARKVTRDRERRKKRGDE